MAALNGIAVGQSYGLACLNAVLPRRDVVQH